MFDVHLQQFSLDIFPRFVECANCCINKPFNAVRLSLQTSVSILDNVPMALDLVPLKSSAKSLSTFWPNNNMAKPPTPTRHRPSHHTSRHICRILRAAASTQSTWVKRGEFFSTEVRRSERFCVAEESTKGLAWQANKLGNISPNTETYKTNRRVTSSEKSSSLTQLHYHKIGPNRAPPCLPFLSQSTQFYLLLTLMTLHLTLLESRAL